MCAASACVPTCVCLRVWLTVTNGEIVAGSTVVHPTGTVTELSMSVTAPLVARSRPMTVAPVLTEMLV